MHQLVRRTNDGRNRRTALCLASIVLCVASGTAVGQEPEVLVELERERVFEGESVRYSVLLNHCENSAQPLLPATPHLQFQHVGVTITRRTTFDGFKRISIGGPQHEYVVTPLTTGEITIPGPTVTVAGKTYRGRDLNLRVVPPNQQDLAILEMSCDRQAVYPLQPFRMRLTVALKALPEPYSEKDPLQGVGAIPVLSIPWAEDEQLPDGVEPETPSARWLQDWIAEGRRPIGFGINNLRLRSGLQWHFSGPGFGGIAGPDPFSLLSDPQRALFHPKPNRTRRQDSRGRPSEYWEYTLYRNFTAQKLGALTFGPVTLKGAFAFRINSAGEVVPEDVYAIAKPVVVEVRGAPAAGRPDSYINAVGRFQVDAALTPTTVKVGDPMTYTLRLFGPGALADATPPQLEQMPAVAEAFKVYQATEDSSEGERRFIYNLRPKKAGIREFPAIELAYFDYNQERYITMRTEPIKIQVAESDRLATQDIAVAASTLPGGGPAIEASAEGIFANITDPQRVVDQSVRPEAWLLSLLSMAGVFVITALVHRRVERRRNDPDHQRRRMAVKKANSLLTESRRLAAANSRRAAIESLSAAITGLVADALCSPEAALTSQEVARELKAVGVSEPLIERCRQLLDDLDAARYGDGAPRVEAQVAAAEQLLADLVRELRQRRLAL